MTDEEIEELAITMRPSSERGIVEFARIVRDRTARAAKLEVLGEAYQRIESGASWDGVLDQMMIELASREKP